MLVTLLLPLFALLSNKMITVQCIPACNGIPQVPFSPFPQVVAPSAISPIAVAESVGFPRGFSPSFRSGFPIQSTSPRSISGLSIRSENAYEGPLLVGGRLPFLSTVAVEGQLPSFGAGGVLYGCGAQDFGIVSEELGPISPGSGLLPGVPGLYSGRVI